METRIVTVVGASGSLGSEIVRALLEKGARVRAMVRATSDRTKLESLGVTDFVVADLMDPTSLQRALTAEPRAEAVVASAAGFSAHTARTKGDNSRTDTEGYRNLVDAAKNAGVPRVVLISILECDKASEVPHFHQKFVTEQYLAEKRQPYLALRAGAFLDRAQDIVACKGSERSLSRHCPRSRHEHDLHPGSRSVCGPGRPRRAGLGPESERGCMLRCSGHRTNGGRGLHPGLGPTGGCQTRLPAASLSPMLPLVAWFVPSLRDQIAVLAWIRKGGYVSHESQKQKDLFGELPTIEDSVARYCRDKGLVKPAAS